MSQFEAALQRLVSPTQGVPSQPGVGHQGVLQLLSPSREGWTCTSCCTIGRATFGPHAYVCFSLCVHSCQPASCLAVEHRGIVVQLCE